MTTTALAPVRRTDLIVGAVATVVPAVLAATVLAAEAGRAERVAVLGALLGVEALLLGAFLIRIRIVLDREGALVRRGPGNGLRIRKGEVRSAVFRSVYASGSLDRRRHLFLLDAKGGVALRITDFWWRPQDLTRVAQHFEVPIESVPETLTASELRRLAAGQLRWWERHPLLGRVTSLGAITAACVVLAIVVESVV